LFWLATKVNFWLCHLRWKPSLQTVVYPIFAGHPYDFCRPSDRFLR
jgi:hypothetical protein